MEEQVPVAAERTLFHIGSNTKLFTWTAVVQLVEEGKLNLDADVNSYLDFSIPDTYLQPITFRHLMTHTAGFENRDIGMLARMRALLMLPLLGTVLTSCVLVCAVLAWWRGLWSLPARFHYTAAALAGLALKWFQASWNLLGFRL